jgi:hypothetical protein
MKKYVSPIIHTYGYLSTLIQVGQRAAPDANRKHNLL